MSMRAMAGFVVVVFALVGCGSVGQPAYEVQLNEAPVTEIPVSFPVGSPADMNISSMTWLDGNTLVLVPQRPAMWGEGDGVFFTLQRAEIEAYLDGEREDPLQAGTIRVVAPNIERFTAGYSGYEAMAFAGDTAIGTIEAITDERTGALVVSGEVSPGQREVTFGITTLTLVISGISEPGYSHEAVVTDGDVAYVIHELNGRSVTEQPDSRVFALADRVNESAGFPEIGYRITDATALDEEMGVFWVMNTYDPRTDSIRPAGDALFETYGTGQTHSEQRHVERIVPLRIGEGGITLADEAPIVLELAEGFRPWEGVAMLGDRGFLLVTTAAPVLGFAPAP